MLEKDVGSELVQGAALAGVRVWKLHNSEYQRGVLDYLVWWKGGPLLQLELKREKIDLKFDAGAKVYKALSSIQQSIFDDMAWGERGVLLATGTDSLAALWLCKRTRAEPPTNFQMNFESHGAKFELNNKDERKKSWAEIFANLKRNLSA